MMLALAAFCLLRNRENRRPLADFSWREVGAAIRESVWELPLPVVVLGGIYSGYFAVSEAARSSMRRSPYPTIGVIAMKRRGILLRIVLVPMTSVRMMLSTSA